MISTEQAVGRPSRADAARPAADRAGSGGAGAGTERRDGVLEYAGRGGGGARPDHRACTGRRRRTGVTYRELRDDAMRVAGGFIAAGLAPGSPWCCSPTAATTSSRCSGARWRRGPVPVPLAPDARRVLPGVGASRPAPGGGRRSAARPCSPSPARTRYVRCGWPSCARAPRRSALPVPAPGDVALLQFSSGSTGPPKGVELTHAGVLANLDRSAPAAAIGPDDVVASWMPYFHDMGLIGTHLAPLAARAQAGDGWGRCRSPSGPRCGWSGGPAPGDRPVGGELRAGAGGSGGSRTRRSAGST